MEDLEKHLRDSEARVPEALDTRHGDVAKVSQNTSYSMGVYPKLFFQQFPMVTISLARQRDLLKLNALSPDLDLLNELSYRLPLSDLVSRRLQTLNRRWAAASSLALEQCR